jgi:hypothetical protein
MTRWLAFATLAACAHDVRTQFPAPPDPSSGVVEVVLNQPSSALTVTIDGHLLAARAHSRRVRVEGVPSGDAKVQVAIGGGCEQGRLADFVVAVTPGQVSTLVVPGPEPSTGCAVLNGLALVALGMEAVALAVEVRTSVHGAGMR